MLEEVQELGDSVTRDQIHGLKDVLGNALYDLLDYAFESETEDEAKERVGVFVSAAKTSPLKLFEARKILSKNQMEIVMGFLGDDE